MGDCCTLFGVHPARRIWRALVLFVCGLVIVLALDRYLYGWVYGHDSSFLRMAKEFGYLPFWLLPAAALLLEDFHKRAESGWLGILRRAGFLFSSALCSGLVAEILKLIIRRERPQSLVFESSIFRSWNGEWWRSNDLSTPSSHAAVVFGAAWALWFMFPRQRILWLFMALACGFSRVVHQAHLPSDVYLAAWLALAVSLILRARLWPEVSCGLSEGDKKC